MKPESEMSIILKLQSYMQDTGQGFPILGMASLLKPTSLSLFTIWESYYPKHFQPPPTSHGTKQGRHNKILCCLQSNSIIKATYVPPSKGYAKSTDHILIRDPHSQIETVSETILSIARAVILFQKQKIQSISLITPRNATPIKQPLTKHEIYRWFYRSIQQSPR